jgi:hypothetical protein
MGSVATSREGIVKISRGRTATFEPLVRVLAAAVCDQEDVVGIDP